MTWYKQDRNLFERMWAKDDKMIAVYVYLHCCAYLRDGMLHGQLIRRGSCPTTRSAIMEATGLSESEVKLRLRRLQDVGEIIVKTSNRGMIITICDYDSCNEEESIFPLNQSDQTPAGRRLDTTPGTPLDTPYIDNNNIDNLISPLSPYKMERENKDLALEIKRLYNKTFGGILRRWDRLSADMRIKIDTCIGRFGRQSVDMVFDQVRHEKFSLGENTTGFIADFAFIFKLANYEAYLGRYELRMKKGQKSQPQAEEKSQVQPQPQSTGSWLDAYSENSNWKPTIRK